MQLPAQRTVHSEGREFASSAMRRGERTFCLSMRQEDLLTRPPYISQPDWQAMNSACGQSPLRSPKKSGDSAAQRGIRGFDRHLAAGRIRQCQGSQWYLKGDQLDLKEVATNGWRVEAQRRLRQRLRMRVSGNAFWLQPAGVGRIFVSTSNLIGL